MTTMSSESIGELVVPAAMATACGLAALLVPSALLQQSCSSTAATATLGQSNALEVKLK